MLEARITASEPEWTIELIPPAGELPAAIPFADGEPDAAGAKALGLIGWAAQRTGRGVVLTGPAAQAEAAAAILRDQDVEVTLRSGGGPLGAQWATSEG